MRFIKGCTVAALKKLKTRDACFSIANFTVANFKKG
jgi:hypothetical protein